MRRARVHGEHLKHLRTACSLVHKAIADGTEPEVIDEIMLMVKNKTGKELYCANHGVDENNKIEISNITDGIEERKVLFVHHPDLVDMTHIVAIRKETDEKTGNICLAAMNT